MEKVDEISESFLRLEKNLHLFESQFSDVYIWDYIRYSIYLEIKKKKTKKLVANTSLRSSFIRSVFLLLGSLYHFVRNLPKYKIKLDTDFVFMGHPRKIFENGHYIDKYCHDIVQELNKKYSVKMLDLPFKLRHYKDEEAIDIRYLDVYEYLMIFAPYLMSLKFSKKEIDCLKTIEFEIKKEFQVTVDITSHVKKAVKQYKLLSRRIEKFFTNNTLKCLISVDGYDFIKKLFIQKANQFSIPTIELQHGAVGYFHIAYRYLEIRNSLDSFPKYFFIWGEHWNKYLLLPKGAFSKIVGFPYLEKRVTTKKTSKKNILIISQWTIGFELIEFVNELAFELPEYDFFFKLHPNEIDEFERYNSSIRTNNISIVRNEIGLYDLFNKSVAQIGVYSTALIEGLAFNLPTFIVPIKGSEAFEGFIHDDIMIKLRSAVDITNELNRKGASSHYKKEVWSKDATTKNIREIKNIIQIQ